MRAKVGTAMMVLALLAGCGGTSNESAPTTTVALTTTTTVETLKTWFAPSRPYSLKVIGQFEQLATAAGRQDLETVQQHSGEIADTLRDMRLSLGTPPPGYAVEGASYLDSLSRAENDARSVASCTGVYGCGPALSTFTVSMESLTRATKRVTDTF